MWEGRTFQVRVTFRSYRLRGLFSGDFNLANFIGWPNLNHAVLTRTHEMN